MENPWRVMLPTTLVLVGAVATIAKSDPPTSVDVQAAAAGDSEAPPGRPTFQLPFPCGEQWRLDTWAHHPAIDMVKAPTQHGTEGAPLLASAGGVVNQSYLHDHGGNLVQIDHGGGWFTTSIHLQSRSVSVGQRVTQGQQIGLVGETGAGSNDHPHLHYEQAYDANGNGKASWGEPGTERVPAQFDGSPYGTGNNQTFRVTSRNCPAPPDAEVEATTKPHDPSATPTATTAPPIEAGMGPRSIPPPPGPPPAAPPASPTTTRPGVESSPPATTAPPPVPVPPGPPCPVGNICAYSGPGLTGQRVVTSYGDWSGPPVAARSVINNGHEDPGQDHIDLTWRDAAGTRHTTCLHYNPGPGAFRRDMEPGDVLVSATWRGEC